MTPHDRNYSTLLYDGKRWQRCIAADSDLVSVLAGEIAHSFAEKPATTFMETAIGPVFQKLTSMMAPGVAML